MNNSKEYNRNYYLKNIKKTKEKYLEDKENKEFINKIKVKSKKYYSENSITLKTKSKKYRKENPLIVKDRNLKWAYNISLEDYNKLLDKQNGVCRICKKEPNIKALAIDHCHITNKVRGLLCTKCNLGLGHFNDNESLLEEAINYLKGN